MDLSLYKNGFDRIREFIRKGGKYIGICAGAYLAPKTVKLRFGETKEGLGIINVENKRRYGIGLKEIEFNESHPLRDILEDIAREISKKAIKIARHAKRKTVRGEDIKLAR